MHAVNTNLQQAFSNRRNNRRPITLLYLTRYLCRYVARLTKTCAQMWASSFKCKLKCKKSFKCQRNTNAHHLLYQVFYGARNGIEIRFIGYIELGLCLVGA